MAEKTLVVDDDDAIRNMLDAFLKAEGYRVDTAEGVDAALRLIESNDYDIMLIDKNMPGTDGNRESGIDLLRHLRSQSVSSEIIMMTGYPTVETAEEAIELGAFDYINKPFILGDLRLKMRRLSKYRSYVKQVEERTAELKAKTIKLEEVNTALRVLLDRREEERKEFEEAIASNLKSLVLPYVEKLQRTRVSSDQATYLAILQSHLAEIESRFMRTLSLQHKGLTPTEMQVAILIKDGKETKDIADILKVSLKAVEFHRNNIRCKLNLLNKKENLRSHLIALSYPPAST